MNFSEGIIYCECKITKYNSLNVKLSNLELNKLNSGIKIGTLSNFKSLIKCGWWF